MRVVKQSSQYNLSLLQGVGQGANVQALPFEEDQYLTPIQWTFQYQPAITADDEISPPTPLSLEDDIFLPRAQWSLGVIQSTTADDEITTQLFTPEEEYWSVNLYQGYQVPVQAFFEDDIWPQSAFSEDPLFYLLTRSYAPPLQSSQDVDDIPKLAYATDEEAFIAPLPWLIKTWPAVTDDDVWPTPGLVEEELWQNPVYPVPLRFFLSYGLGTDDDVFFTPVSTGVRPMKTVLDVG